MHKRVSFGVAVSLHKYNLFGELWAMPPFAQLNAAVGVIA